MLASVHALVHQPSEKFHEVGSSHFYVTDKETGANKGDANLPRVLVRDCIQWYVTEAHQQAAWGREFKPDALMPSGHQRPGGFCLSA